MHLPLYKYSVLIASSTNERKPLTTPLTVTLTEQSCQYRPSTDHNTVKRKIRASVANNTINAQ